MDDRLIVTGEHKEQLDGAEELLDQFADDADALGQSDGARIARQAAEAIRKFTGRLDFTPAGGPVPVTDLYTLRGK